MKIYSTAFILIEMQINNTLKYNSISPKIVIFKKMGKISFGKVME
jgi:hypothetical protein